MYTKTLVPSERLHFLTRNVVLGLPVIHSQATHLSFSEKDVPVKKHNSIRNARNTKGAAMISTALAMCRDPRRMSRSTSPFQSASLEERA